MRLSVRKPRRCGFFAGLGLVASIAIVASTAATPVAPSPAQHSPAQTSATIRRNLIIFIADGLRHDSVNATDAPTLLALRQHGVHFSNSHSLFPTLTTPNASAIATGHYLGDTGDYSNAEYVGFPTFNHSDFGKATGSPTPFLENDPVLGDLDDHAPNGNFLNETSLLALARQHGFNTAAIGKLGPAALQDIDQLKPAEGHFTVPGTVILDDSTGSASGVPVAPEMLSALAAAGLGNTPTPREQPTGTATTPGTLVANVAQQKWFADAATKAVLPTFVHSGKPFVLLFWSRDPDGSQHNQGDSLNKLQPGINGPTSRAGVANADANLKQLLDFVAADPGLSAATDVFVTSDHGFATISRHEIDAAGHGSHSYSTAFAYLGTNGKAEVPAGWLPPGFLAIDLAHALRLPLFDPDTQVEIDGVAHYEPVDPTKQPAPLSRQHPATGNGLIGGTGAVQDDIDAKVIVSASGGTDLVYITANDRDMARNIVDFLSDQDYIGALFADPALGRIPGTLPLSAIALEGSASMPRPSLVVTFKTFELTPGERLSAVQVSDTTLQEGQGMHGGFGRDSTFNNMAAMGPDFKRGFDDRLPVSNADVAPTLARVLGLQLPATGRLRGRVLSEALTDGANSPTPGPAHAGRTASTPTQSGRATILEYQEYEGRRYFDTACLTRAPSGGSTGTCKP